jgi:hypothetical protein
MPAAAVAEGTVGKSSPKKESHSSRSTLPSPSPSSLLRSAADLSFVNCGLKTSPTCTAKGESREDSPCYNADRSEDGGT